MWRGCDAGIGMRRGVLLLESCEGGYTSICHGVLGARQGNCHLEISFLQFFLYQTVQGHQGIPGFALTLTHLGWRLNGRRVLLLPQLLVDHGSQGPVAATTGGHSQTAHTKMKEPLKSTEIVVTNHIPQNGG